MKKIIGFLLPCCLLVSGCQDEEPNAKIQGQQQVNHLSETPSAENVVTSSNSGEIENIDRFYVFLDNVTNQKADSLRVVSYTTEGDPIFQDLGYDGETIVSIVDSSRDSYGSGGVTENVCTEINKEESAERIDYLLEGCKDAEEILVLVLWN